MSCAWLDSNNGWKQQVDALAGCGLPVGAVDGLLRRSPRAMNAGNTLWLASFRVSTPMSLVCFETAYAFARSRFSAATSQVYSHDRSLLTSEIRCPDRSVFDNVSENGACSDFGLRSLL